MPLETLTHCPVCGGHSFSNYLNAEDYTVSHREFTIQQCNSCYFLFTNPRPNAESIGEYYESKDYISHHDDNRSLMNAVYTRVRNHTVEGKVNMLNGYAKGKGSLLDIGCGTGVFVQACQGAGWHVSATEPDPGARESAAKKLGTTVAESIFSSALQDKKFDVITMWHVLEHVHLLNETVSWLAEHLAENGTIVIAVPNPQSADAQKYGRFWAAYDVPRHLYHFTKDAMKTLTKKHGLLVMDILPMWFDSFYVSMLSSKYRSGSIRLPESFIAGLSSNIRGRASRRDALNTSSLIYIIQKQ